MTQRPKLIVTVLLLWCALLLAGLAWLSQREPSYQGRRLSDWARQYGANRSSTKDKEAEFAIRQIGTDGLPVLLNLIQTKDSDVTRKLRTIVPLSWHDKLHLRDNSAEVRRIGAAGLAALGTNAAMAVPTLIEVATEHPDEDGRYVAVYALRTLGSAAEPAIPFLIQCLTNSAKIIRTEAVIGLGDIHRRPEIAVPALATYLQYAMTGPSEGELQLAIASLGRFEAEAKQALPQLWILLNDPRPTVRRSVTNCLLRINGKPTP